MRGNSDFVTFNRQIYRPTRVAQNYIIVTRVQMEFKTTQRNNRYWHTHVYKLADKGNIINGRNNSDFILNSINYKKMQTNFEFIKQLTIINRAIYEDFYIS